MNRTNCSTTMTDTASDDITSARAKVERLMTELRDALAACDQGPLRATVDSDGNGIVQPLAGRPLCRGKRIVGVSTLMLRTIYGPERQPRDIIVGAAR